METPMVAWWWMPILVVGIALVLRRFNTHTLDDAMVLAQKSGEVDGLVALILAQPVAQQATLWDQALKGLWQGYARETAASLLMRACEHTQADFTQFWLRKFMEVEPELAQEQFDEGFLLAHFRPEVAAGCGSGACGCG